MWIMLIETIASARSDRPRRRGDVERERRQEVRQAGVGAMSRDARERFRIAIGRLPGQPRQRGRAMHGMLARAARDLEHHPAGRQHAAQHGKDRLAIARRRGRGEQGGVRRRPIIAGSSRAAFEIIRSMPASPATLSAAIDHANAGMSLPRRCPNPRTRPASPSRPSGRAGARPSSSAARSRANRSCRPSPGRACRGCRSSPATGRSRPRRPGCSGRA